MYVQCELVKERGYADLQCTHTVRSYMNGGPRTTVLAVVGTERSSHQWLSDSVSALEPAAPAGELCRGDTRDSSYGDTHNNVRAVDLYLNRKYLYGERVGNCC